MINEGIKNIVPKKIRELFDDEIYVLENEQKYHPKVVTEARHKVEAMERIAKMLSDE